MKFNLSIAYSRGRPLNRFKTYENVEVTMKGEDMYARFNATHILVLHSARIIEIDEDRIRVEGYERMDDIPTSIHYHQEWMLRRNAK